MPKSILIKRVASVVIISVLVPMLAQANPCKSQWQGLITEGSLKAEFRILADTAWGFRNLGCATGTSFVATNKCIDAFEKLTKKINKWKNTGNNVTTGPNHIGPRVCAPAHAYTGNVKAERVFVCTPVTQKQWTLDLKLTGGKGKKTLTVDVCLVDNRGRAVKHFTQTFDGAKGNAGAKFNKTTFGKAAGLTPLIYLHKKAGTGGYKYELKTGEKGGEPRGVEQARKQLAAGKKTSGRIRKK